MPSLLIIDDDPQVQSVLKLALGTESIAVRAAGSAAEGIASFAADRPDVVLLDVRLPDQSGLATFQQLHEIDAKVPTILMTGHGTAATAIEAMRLGAFEYVLKPLDLDRITTLVEDALQTSRLMRVPAVVEAEAADDSGVAHSSSDVLIGRCPAMQNVYRAIGRVAPQDVTVLITGESGTGKEVVARAIYHYSRRSQGPFLAINCAAIPEPLLEAELFGHEKGAFTGADRRRIGKFEQCHGGTLFLDEIGDMTPLTQTKILRVLQEQAFERVGGAETIRTDVRVIAATNRPLETMIAQERFRRDLFYRLNVYAIGLPPLRERGEDIEALADYFVKRFSGELRRDTARIADETRAALQRHTWPGNVRELQSAIKHALLQTTGPVLLPSHLPEGVVHPAGEKRTEDSGEFDLASVIERGLASGDHQLYDTVIAQVDREVLRRVLGHTGGNLSEAARVLGISRNTLRAKLTAAGLHESSG